MATTSKWRLAARRILRETLADARVRGLDDKETLKVVAQAYPWGDRSGHVYQMWLKERKECLAAWDRGGKCPIDDGVDRDYFARLDGPGSPAWDAMLCRKRAELHAAGIEADDWTDEAVADWRPGAKEGAGDD
jgi:hypothetical protein